jgi:hypothetical protein
MTFRFELNAIVVDLIGMRSCSLELLVLLKSSDASTLTTFKTR